MNNQYRGEEKRRQKRIDVSFIVMYRVNAPVKIRLLVGDKEVCAIALDLSEGGMAVLTNYEVPALALVTVKFIVLNERATSVKERTRSLEVSGEVRYCVMTKEKVYRLGILFTDLSQDDRQFIADFITLQSRP